MNKVIIMTGISGQGKSTYALENFPLATYLNADRIRGELCDGNESDQSKNPEVFPILFNRFYFSLDKENDVVVDNTSLTFKDRNKFYNIVNEFRFENDDNQCVIELVYCIPNLDLAIKRNALRERKVPEDVIHRQFNKIQPPTSWELENILVTFVNL